MNLRPGRHDSTGDSEPEVRQKGGYELYVCPAGYIAVDADDNPVERIIPAFKCKQQ
jgi:hypothetical protein